MDVWGPPKCDAGWSNCAYVCLACCVHPWQDQPPAYSQPLMRAAHDAYKSLTINLQPATCTTCECPCCTRTSGLRAENTSSSALGTYRLAKPAVCCALPQGCKRQE